MASWTSFGTLTLATVHTKPAVTPATRPTHCSRIWARINAQPSRLVVGPNVGVESDEISAVMAGPPPA